MSIYPSTKTAAKPTDSEVTAIQLRDRKRSRKGSPSYEAKLARNREWNRKNRDRKQQYNENYTAKRNALLDGKTPTEYLAAHHPDKLEERRRRIREAARAKPVREVSRYKARAYARGYYHEVAKHRPFRQKYILYQGYLRIFLLKLKPHNYAWLVGCTADQLRAHFESQFEKGMSWDNYGKGPGRWSSDHIAPATSFDLTDREQAQKCYHYTNLRPLWFRQNASKASALEPLRFDK